MTSKISKLNNSETITVTERIFNEIANDTGSVNESAVINNTVSTTQSLIEVSKSSLNDTKLNNTFKTEDNVTIFTENTSNQTDRNIQESTTVPVKSDVTISSGTTSKNISAVTTASVYVTTTQTNKQKTNSGNAQVPVTLPPPPAIIPVQIETLSSQTPTNAVAVELSTYSRLLNNSLPTVTTSFDTTTSGTTLPFDSQQIKVFLPPPPLSETPSISLNEVLGLTTVDIPAFLNVEGNNTEKNAEIAPIIYPNVTESINMTSQITQTSAFKTATPASNQKTPTNRLITVKASKKSKTVLEKVPEHPPPIFVNNRRQPKPYEESQGAESLLKNSRPKTTTENAPPPIFIPHGAKTNVIEKQTTTPTTFVKNPYVYTQDGPGDNDPRYMSTLELAVFALKNLGRNSNKQTGKGLGVQTFFPTTPKPSFSSEVTTPSSTVYRKMTTTLVPREGILKQEQQYVSTSHTNVAPSAENIVYDKEYYLQKYVFGKTTTMPRNPFVDKLIQPTQPRKQEDPSTEAPRPFFDANYLLTMITSKSNLGPQLSSIPQQAVLSATGDFTQKPQFASNLDPSIPSSLNTEWTNMNNLKNQAISQISRERASDSQQMKNQQMLQAETRPLNWPAQTDAQPFIGYRVEKAAQNQLLADGLGSTLARESNTVDRRGKDIVQDSLSFGASVSSFTQDRIETNTLASDTPLQNVPRRKPFSKYRPRDHVYGSTRLLSTSNDPGHELRERFNRKWSLLETSVEPEQIVAGSQQAANELVLRPFDIKPSTQKPVEIPETNARKLFNLIFNLPPSFTFREVPKLTPRQPETLQETQAQQQQLKQTHIQELQKLIDHKRKTEKQQLILQIPTRNIEDQLPIQQNLPKITQQQFPLAAQIGKSEIRDNSQPDTFAFNQNSSPKVSSIQIFQAPAFRLLRKRHKPVLAEMQESNPVQTHWKALPERINAQNQLPVSYQLNANGTQLGIVFQTTTNIPRMSLQTESIPLNLRHTANLRNIRTNYPQTTSIPTTSSTQQPTVPPTADPNPPPIFDTKIQVTFMPIPKIERVTKASKNNSDMQLADQQTSFDGKEDMLK